MVEVYIQTEVGETAKFEKLAFREGHLPVELNWTIMVILLKGGG